MIENYVGWVRLLHEDQPSDFRATMLGLFTEAAEALAELPWRPWRVADQRDPTPEEVARAADELGDVVGCAVRAMIALGLDDRQVDEALWGHVERQRQRRDSWVNG